MNNFLSVNFWEASVWNFIIQIAVLILGMLIAHIIIRSFKFIRNSLIPSAVLGGFLLFVFNAIFKLITDSSFFDSNVLEIITYHGLGLGFAAMTLKSNKRKLNKRDKSGVFDAGTVVVSTYLLQGLLGLLITIGLGYSFFPDLFKAAGIILPLGFGQGPGQALNFSSNYENLYGFEGGSSFGLTIASMGFIAASIGGVIYLNIMRKKGRLKHHFERKDLQISDFSNPNEIPSSDSMDKITIQVGLVLLAYFAAYLLMYGISFLCDFSKVGFLINTVKPLIWGFNFLFSTLTASILKLILSSLTKKEIIHREYTSNFLLTRVGGFMFDLMVVASIAAIKIEFLEKYFIPLICLGVVGGILSYYQIKILTKRLFPDYPDEAFLSLYGNLTGTASTGVILLREADPNFETPAADNLVLMNLPAIIMGFPIMLLVGYAPQGTTQLFISLAAITLLFIMFTVIQCLRIKQLKKVLEVKE